MLDDITKRRNKFIKDYKKDKGKYDKFANQVKEKIKNALSARNVYYAYASSREKDIDSLEKKCLKKILNADGTYSYKYNDFRNEIMDLAGVRIVTYLLEDIEEVSNVIKELFDVEETHSGNKLDLLGADKIGYLSVHYIISLKEESIEAGEEGFRGLKCEIQVRTVLEDSWAQIFHDRQYKNDSNSIPTEQLIRKTNLLSGNLELLDYQINDLVKEYDILNDLDKKKKLNRIINNKINRDDFIHYFLLKFERSLTFYNYKNVKTTLEKNKINNFRAFDAILQDAHCEEKIKEKIIEDQGCLTADRIIYYVLIINNYKKFFNNIGDNIILSKDSYDFLKEFIDIDRICKEHNIDKEN